MLGKQGHLLPLPTTANTRTRKHLMIDASQCQPVRRGLFEKPTDDSDLRDPHGDRGVSLIELLMVIAITSIVGALVVGTIIVVGNLVAKTTERTEDFINSKHAIEEISVNLRGATNYEQARGRLTNARPNAVVFYTTSGDGLTGEPVLMSYAVLNGTLFRTVGVYDQAKRKWDFGPTSTHKALLNGIVDTNVFEYYTWADPNEQNSCFKKIDERDLDTNSSTTGSENPANTHARNSIAGVKVKLKFKSTNTIRFNKIHEQTTWIRLGESIEPKDPKTGALIAGWPKNCWDKFGKEFENSND